MSVGRISRYDPIESPIRFEMRNIQHIPQKIRRRDITDPVYALSDIHGHIDLLEKALEWIDGDSKLCRYSTNIVFCGDYVDDGPDSRSVLERLRRGPNNPKHHWHILRGNHEQMMYMSFKDSRILSLWLANGGLSTVQSYGYQDPSELDWYKFRGHLSFIRYMRLYIEDEDRIFVHAGIRDIGNGHYTLDEQSENDLLWISPREMDRNWPTRMKKLLVHGHIPLDPGSPGKRICIDGGAGRKGRGLKVVKFTDQREPVDIRIFD